MYFLRCKLMKIAGIIAEYNPFHTGHAYHIQKTRKITDADFVITVISGDFVQRGGPAFLSKHQRTRMALLGGADLVFELPATHSCESAEFFARSGVELLHGLGCVDVLSFGSECGDIRPFQVLGTYLADEPDVFRTLLQEKLKSGLSFPAARRNALSELLSGEKSIPDLTAFLSSPNNILGIEYCKALHRLNSPIQPVTLLREGNGYHEKSLGREFPSASAVRNFCLSLTAAENPPKQDPVASKLSHAADTPAIDQLSGCFPPEVFSYLQSEHLLRYTVTEQDFSLLLRWLVMSSDAENLSSYLDLSPDLANRMIHAAEKYENFSQFISLIKTKELTYSRICRALFHALLDIRSVPSLPYARLLGFRKSAAPVLTRIKEMGTLPLITKLADAPSILDEKGISLLNHNTRISNLYETILCEKTHKTFVHEYSKPLVILPS